MDVGLFIVLEGIDGVGKSTQVALLGAWLDAAGVAYITTREPGGTAVGEAIREVVLSRTDLDMPPESELLLILAARAAFVHDVVRPALASGTTVVADRFSLSTLAYQGHGRGLPLDRVRDCLELATGGLSPDLCLVLDLPLDESRDRQRRHGDAPDRIEREGERFRAAVRDGYLALAESEPNVEVVDARGAPADVHQRLRRRLEARFPTLRAAGGSTDSTRVG